MSDLAQPIWSEATHARSRALKKEAAAEQARSAYHEAIRRLHTSGASLREIARRLEISHQRVHQIVSDTACGFCGRRRADVARLVAGPGVFVCNDCVSLGLHALAQGWGARRGDLVLDVTTDRDLTCCFCRKTSRKTGPLVVRGIMRICGRCLALAAATLEEQERPSPIRGRKKRRRERTIGATFTDRLDKALGLAAQEAANLGHASILPDHLVLGILGVADSLGAKVLTESGVDRKVILQDLVARHPEGSEPTDPLPGMAPETKRTLELARSEAESLNHNYVGTEHVLLALAESSGPVAQLSQFGPNTLREQIHDLLYG